MRAAITGARSFTHRGLVLNPAAGPRHRAEVGTRPRLPASAHCAARLPTPRQEFPQDVQPSRAGP